jgi:Asp-tRNA(Asn)/Glu-tRNA(Gln) amidotransferase A subunit family amidase
MGENNLDALVYAYTTIPPHIILTNRLAKTVETHTEPRILKAGTVMSDPTLVPDEPVLKSDLDTYRGSGSTFAVSLSPETGFPAIVVPDDSDPNSSRLEGPKKVQLPVALEFLARPFEETTLFAIASAFESIKRHRRPPPGFGELHDR